MDSKDNKKVELTISRTVSMMVLAIIIFLICSSLYAFYDFCKTGSDSTLLIFISFTLAGVSGCVLTFGDENKSIMKKRHYTVAFVINIIATVVLYNGLYQIGETTISELIAVYTSLYVCITCISLCVNRIGFICNYE